MILNEFFNLPQVFEKDMAEVQSQHTDMTVAQQVFKDNPNIDHEDDILNAAFPYVVELVGSRKRANYMFNYDEDFPSDLIGAYRYLQRDQHDVGLEEGEPGDLEHELEKQDYQRRQQRDSDAEKALNKKDQDVEEGIFGSRPSPVLPLVDKIGKLAGGLTPQNLEVGKQIIQANVRNIQRMLSPQSKAGIEVIEAAKWRDPKYKDQLYTQEPPDYNDTREYDRAMFDPKPDDYPGRKELPGGGEYDRTDPLVRGAGIGRSGIKNNILDRGKRKGLPSRDQITSLKQSIKDISGRHTRANLPEQGVAEAKDDYVPPKEANYDDKYQAMVRRVGQKAKQQEKAKQQQPKAPVRESRLALLKQIIQS